MLTTVTRARALGLAVLLPVALLISSCGGSESTRPSADSISQALRAKDIGAALGSQGGGALSKQAADCIAAAIHDSEMSDKGVRDFLEGGTTFSDADTEAFTAILGKVAACSR